MESGLFMEIQYKHLNFICIFQGYIIKILLSILFLFIFSCQDGLDVNTTKHTATDPIADITYLNDYFYTTNLDSSGNAGHQIDLYKLDSLSNPINRFEFPLNGQGYLAATDDGSNLFFQPRYTDYIFKSTPLGEIFWYQPDNFPDNTADTTSTFMYWRGRGLAWADTNLVALYRHKDDSTRYRGRYLHVNNDTLQTVLDITVIWDHLDNYGAYAMEYNSGTRRFWVLARESLDKYIIFEVDSMLQYLRTISSIDGSPKGITMGPDSLLYLSYPGRKIVPY